MSVRAEVANFVNINIGVDAYLDKLKLGIKGVEAQVLLKVKLEKILGTIDRALSAIEQNPGLLDDRLRGFGQEAGQIENSVGGTEDLRPQVPSPVSTPEGEAEVEAHRGNAQSGGTGHGPLPDRGHGRRRTRAVERRAEGRGVAVGNPGRRWCREAAQKLQYA